MKIIAFTDFHASGKALKKVRKKIKKEKPDLLICTGDITIFGQSQKKVIQSIADLGMPTLIVHGNHEDYYSFREQCRKHKNLTNMHKKIKAINGFTFLGYGGEGFRIIVPEFEHWAEKIKNKIKNKKLVLLIHAPPYNTKLDITIDEHCGCNSFTKFIRKYKNNIVLTLCGHLHENFKVEDKIGNVRMINPGPDGMVITI